MKEFEGWDDVKKSFAIELVLTCILLFFIYINVTPGNKYTSYLKISNSNYTYGFIITGLILTTLLYIATYIALNFNISTGHMSPLLTIPAMFFPLGVLSVSLLKGLFLLLAQAIASIFVYLIVFKTGINN